MAFLIISVIVVLGIWAICSLAEATMYAVRREYARQLMESGSGAGHILARFKENMEQPISAILIINTAVSAAGGAITGAQVRVLFGETALVWFSVFFTMAALFLSEIAPKVVGVAFNRQLAPLMAAPLSAMVVVLYPLVWLIGVATRILMPNRSLLAPEEEVAQFAAISAEEGSIMPYEADLVHNALRLDQLTACEMMTPRPVVTKLRADLSLKEAVDKIKEWTFSRMPIYSNVDPDMWTGFVLSRDILAAVAAGRAEGTLESICKPLFFVSE